MRRRLVELWPWRKAPEWSWRDAIMWLVLKTLDVLCLLVLIALIGLTVFQALR